MKRRRIGRTSLSVTELGLGGAPLGNLYFAIDDEAALATIDAAWHHGLRYFDTAPHYGLGLSEHRLGDALAGRPRDEFVVSTKVGRLIVDNPAPSGSDLAAGGFDVPDTRTRLRDYSRDGVLRSLDDSLSRLRLDKIDIVYVHDPEDHMDDALDHALPALAELRAQGVIAAIGAGMNHSDPLLRIVRESDVDVVMVAGRWTLADRRAAELLSAAQARSVSVVAAAPFNSGLLSDPWAADSRFDYQAAPRSLVEFARRAAQGCADLHVTLQQAALQFPLRHPAVVSVMVGMRSPVEVEANARWAAAPVPERVWPAIERLRADELREIGK